MARQNPNLPRTVAALSADGKDSVQKPHFQRILLSAPVSLGEAGYPGDTGKLGVIYDLGRIMSLGERYEEVMGAELAEVRQIEAHMSEVKAAFHAAWDVFLNTQRARAESSADDMDTLRAILNDADLSPEEKRARARGYLTATDMLDAALPVDTAQVEAFMAASAELAQEDETAAARIAELTLAITHRSFANGVVRIGVLEKRRDPQTRREIAELSWPYAEPEPDPTKPETYDARCGGLLEGYVVEWIAGAGSKKAREQVDGPLFGRPSVVSTTPVAAAT